MSDGHLTTAIYRRSDGANSAEAMKMIPLGSKVRVSGICVLENSNPFNGPVPFNILLRSTDDIAVIAQPSLLNIRNLLLALGVLLMVVFVGDRQGLGPGTEGCATKRRHVSPRRGRGRPGAAAQPHSRRHQRIASPSPRFWSRSRSYGFLRAGWRALLVRGRPTERAGRLLGGAVQACASSARASTPALGPALGTLFAGLNRDTPPVDRETVALTTGARLATLAIETRRLYADLRHRSEFDLLTDIQTASRSRNIMDLQMEEARQSGRIFGLIYIDLDQFKLVNDTTATMWETFTCRK